ncbi:transposase [Candidatus Merdisoma sp. JLR.KK006]|uniref:transposase n=1 Tax=Candidatus Merdisoma sp. JLR.KK006 TaxID=3112626 RepID=UPI00331306BD
MREQKDTGLGGRIRGLLDTDKIREIRSKDDEDARFGHKTPTSTFYGYKNHLAMTEEGLIAGINVTPGGEPGGRQLSGLIEKAQKNGIEVTEVIGDMAYISEDNVDACGERIRLTAKTNPAVAAAAEAKLEEGLDSVITKMQKCCNVRQVNWPCGLRSGRQRTGTSTGIMYSARKNVISAL